MAALTRAVDSWHAVERLESRVLLSGYTLSSIPLPVDAGSSPKGTLAIDADDNLYGTASSSGAFGKGTVFEMPRGTTTIRALASFDGANGENPGFGVTLDSDGNLYGTTSTGGPSGKGTVFEIIHGTSTIRTLGYFDGANGSSPAGGVTLDASGNIYGTTSNGGPSDLGTVFKIARGTTSIQTLGGFNGTNGSHPSGDVALDPAGNLYGTTQLTDSSPAPTGKGTVFELPHGTGTIRTLAAFNGSNGAAPNSGVTMDDAGNLYGTTHGGEKFPYGTVFRIDDGTTLIRTLDAFNGADGYEPDSGVALDAVGNVYGTTELSIYEIANGTSTIQMLAQLSGCEGGVTLDKSGNLYTTTLSGGAPYGAVLKFSPTGSSSTPFLGNPINIDTATIQAEDFNDGADGVAYHDTTTQNIPGAYRNTGVDVGAVGNASNGFAVGYTAPGEWLAYSVTAPSDGTYVLQSTVANYQQGGAFHVEIDGQNVTGPMTVPNTGPWDTWQTISSPAFKVSAGSHTMRVVMDSGGYWGNIGDFDSFKFVQRGPFHGTPFNISTDTIEAENFDNGGEGVAYHDTTPQNIPGAYRNTGVDVAAVGNASSGHAVGYTAPGEWLNYSITASSAGAYVLQANVANYKQGGTFHVEIDGVNVTGAMTVPDTGPWDTWQTITSQAFNVSAGSHVMRVVMDSGGYWGNIGDFDSFRFVVSVPFLGRPFKVAAETIEAECFDNGGEGSAFHDSTPQNLGGKYRTTAVDINPGGSNGYDVGYTAPGEWLKYSIANPDAGTFVLHSAVASSKAGGTFHIEIDGQNVTGSMTVPDTGGWYNFQTVVSPKFSVPAGDHTMKVVMDSAGALGAIGNFDYFRFVPAGVVTLISQDRSVTTYSYPAPPGESWRVVRTDPGDFSPFEYGYDYYGSAAAQSSSLDFGTTGAQLAASLLSETKGSYHSSYQSGWASFNVVFDVDSPVTYRITGQQSSGLSGPGGDISMSYNPIQGLYFSTGMLQSGRYTLGGSVSPDGKFDVTLDLGSAALDRPLVVGVQTIEAENFDDGNEGTAYHDITPQNQGGQFRYTGVDINPGGSYGFNVGYTAPGEWLKYSLTNPSAGDFLLQAAVASSKPGGTFHVEMDGQNVTGPLTVPDTAGWYNFQTVVSPKFTVPAGDHTMKVVMDSAGASGAIGNFDYFRFVPTGIITPISQARSVTSGSQAYEGGKSVEADPGNFGMFQRSVGDASGPGASGNQSSNFEIGTTGARFLASGGLAVSSWGPMPPPEARSSLQIVFDVSTSVPYTISYSQSVSPANTSLTLDGPDGPLFVYDPSKSSYFSTGTLQVGRYTLSANVKCDYFNLSYQLVMELGSTITPQQS